MMDDLRRRFDALASQSVKDLVARILEQQSLVECNLAGEDAEVQVGLMRLELLCREYPDWRDWRECCLPAAEPITTTVVEQEIPELKAATGAGRRISFGAPQSRWETFFNGCSY